MCSYSFLRQHYSSEASNPLPVRCHSMRFFRASHCLRAKASSCILQALEHKARRPRSQDSQEHSRQSPGFALPQEEDIRLDTASSMPSTQAHSYVGRSNHPLHAAAPTAVHIKAEKKSAQALDSRQRSLFRVGRRLRSRMYCQSKLLALQACNSSCPLIGGCCD